MKSIDLTAIDLNLLVAFEALLEERSVTAAAHRLHLGQPATSAALGRLRVLFEDELFIRIGKEMQPTSKALEIAPGILAALQQIRQTIESSHVFNPVSSHRSFTVASPDYTSYVVAPRLLEFCSRNAPELNFHFIGYEKDGVGELLEQGAIDIALGVFPNPPQHTYCLPLFQEHFVGVVRKGHPAIANGLMSLKTFASLPHALVTLRRDLVGEMDKVLSRHNLQRRIAITIPHMLVLPTIIASSDLVAAVPYRVAARLASVHCLEIFEIPVETESWTVSMLWSQLFEKDTANSWLRQTLKTICAEI